MPQKTTPIDTMNPLLQKLNLIEQFNKQELFYDKAYNWLLNHGPGIVVGIFVLIIGFWLIRLFSKIMHRSMDKHGFDPSLKPFLISLIVSLLRMLLIISVMQLIGIQMTIFVTLFGAFGVAVGLALSGTLQNFASGVLILVLKPFKVGDSIIAQGQEGTVASIQIFYTLVTTFDNRTVVFPNSKLSNDIIINISKKGIRRLDIELKFPLKTDYVAVQTIAKDVVEKLAIMLKRPESSIGITTITETTYTVLVSIWVKADGFNDSKLKLQEQLLLTLKEKGVIA